MKMKYLFSLIGIFVLTIFLIIECSMYEGPEEIEGNLSLTIILSPEQGFSIETYGKAQTPREIEAEDQVHVRISQEGYTMWEDDLTLEDSTFRASITLDAGTGYFAQVFYYMDSILAYTGEKSDITIIAGETTKDTVSLYPTAPQSPTDLIASAMSAYQVDLNWTDNAVNEDGFVIERRESYGGLFTEIDSVGFNVVSYQDTTVSENSEYIYRTYAFNSADNSLPSNQDTVSTIATAPDAPSDLLAIAVSPSQVNLFWNDNSDNEIGFKIERKIGPGGTFSEIGSVGEDVESYPDVGLSENVTYIYRICAFNNIDNSAYSNEASATTQISLSAPTNMQAAVVSISQIDLSWDDNSSNEDGFKIERKIGTGGAFSEIGTVGEDVESYPDVGLNENTTYYYRVCGYNNYGNSGYSNEAEARTDISAPAAPTNLQALAVSGSQIYLSWTDNADNETGFQIERKIEGVDTFAVIDSVGAGTGVINYEDTGLVENTTYYYQVCAYNITDNSDYSNIDSAATNAAIPDAPSDLQALAVSSSQIYLSWTDNANNETGFQIERRIEGVDTFTVIDSVEAGIGVIIYEDTSLVESTTYYYRISAFNSSGTSPYSNEADATTFATIPDPPSDLYTIVVSESQIILMWDDNSFNEEGFRIERKEGAGGAFSEIAILGMEVESYQDTTVDENTTYYL